MFRNHHPPSPLRWEASGFRRGASNPPLHPADSRTRRHRRALGPPRGEPPPPAEPRGAASLRLTSHAAAYVRPARRGQSGVSRSVLVEVFISRREWREGDSSCPLSIYTPTTHLPLHQHRRRKHPLPLREVTSTRAASDCVRLFPAGLQRQQSPAGCCGGAKQQQSTSSRCWAGVSSATPPPPPHTHALGSRCHGNHRGRQVPYHPP